MDKQSRIVIKIKRKLLCDEYILTNKRIICKFKYVVMCFDYSDDEESQGFVLLSADRLKEAFADQDLVLNANYEQSYLYPLITKLKAWHSNISKLEIDVDNMYAIDNLSCYSNCSLDKLYSFKYNSYKGNLDIINACPHVVIDIKVYFKLTKKIDKITDYNVNLSYLNHLLSTYLFELLNEKPIYLDEIGVTPSQIPLSYHTNACDGDIDVYPYVVMIALN